MERFDKEKLARHEAEQLRERRAGLQSSDDTEKAPQVPGKLTRVLYEGQAPEDEQGAHAREQIAPQMQGAAAERAHDATLPLLPLL